MCTVCKRAAEWREGQVPGGPAPLCDHVEHVSDALLFHVRDHLFHGQSSKQDALFHPVIPASVDGAGQDREVNSRVPKDARN
jgi:hypothetical protein